TTIPLCEGGYFVVSGDTLRTSGIYFFHYQSVRGCDSISNITIENHVNTSTVLDTAICQGTQLYAAGKTFDQTGSYLLDLKSAAGCDSLLTLNLRMHPVYDISLDTAFCEGQSIRIGNQLFSQSGVYGIRMSTMSGCDSNLQLKLNVWPGHQRESQHSICKGDSLYFSGKYYFNSGRYENIYLNQFGCDSLEILDLLVKPVDSTRIDTFFCEGKSIRVGSLDYFMEGEYSQRLQNRFSCDSLLNIHVSQNPVYQLRIDTTMCYGGQWRIGNQLLNQSGIYRLPLVSVKGCDSTVTVNMNILPSQQGRLDTSICFADSLVIAGNYFSSPGQYQLNMPGRFGCDSVLDLHIRKSEIPDVQVDKVDLRCFGDQSGRISLTVSGNASPYRIVWEDGRIAFLRDKLNTGRYAFTVWDDNQCSRELGVDINTPDPLVMDYLKRDANCASPESGTLQLLQAKGGTKPYSYFINGIRWSNLAQTGNVDIGNHVLEMVDSNGCRIFKSFSILPPVRGETALDPDSVFIIAGDTVWLEVRIRQINGIRSVKWTGPGIFDCDTCLRTAVFMKQAEGVFKVIITDDQSCLYEETIVISSRRQFNIPNVFSPNGDGINDLFNIVTDRSVAIIDLLQIFDRWGNQVYEARNFLPGDSAGSWNGEIGGRRALPGVYVYLFVFRDKLGQGYKRSGDLTLIR
ncbi:MAG TPA: gliding motility-associated C-terminal domain-containing protein, partial [Saprospiraceae bacterium]|nr:gliding motility-associated C-terminal domain-containing protein [Saprospiraceae bacterium]